MKIPVFKWIGIGTGYNLSSLLREEIILSKDDAVESYDRERLNEMFS